MVLERTLHIFERVTFFFTPRGQQSFQILVFCVRARDKVADQASYRRSAHANRLGFAHHALSQHIGTTERVTDRLEVSDISHRALDQRPRLIDAPFYVVNQASESALNCARNGRREAFDVIHHIANVDDGLNALVGTFLHGVAHLGNAVRGSIEIIGHAVERGLRVVQFDLPLLDDLCVTGILGASLFKCSL